MIDLIAATNEITRHFKMIGQTITGRVGNEPVIILTSGGVKKEGARMAVWCGTPDKALELFISEFKKYSANKGSCLYWRRMPEVRKIVVHYNDCFCEEPGHMELFTIYARLLVTHNEYQDND